VAVAAVDQVQAAQVVQAAVVQDRVVRLRLGQPIQAAVAVDLIPHHRPLADPVL
jgi:hypothetical protein